MKRFLLATVALAALSAPAAAADLATKYPVKAIPAPVFSWTGFYIGANFGYGGDKFSYDAAGGYLSGYPWAASADINSSGFFAGGQIGYNYQFANNIVLGVETDLQWSDIEGKVGFNAGGVLDPVGVNGSIGSSVDYFGTIRARLGYAYDRFLPYITGGAAYGKTKNEVSLSAYDYDYASGFGLSSSSTKWGWTIGAGVEYAITPNWTFKTEYLYVDLGSSDLDLTGLGTLYADIYNDAGVSVDTKFHTIKAGVNYKF